MIRHEVLGLPGHDNALWVEVDSGQSCDMLVFDCGEACLHRKTLGELQQVSHLFFSHLHMDHVSGFDTFFRANFNRGVIPVHIWGPPGSAEILQGRMRGYWWNFTYDEDTAWYVHEVGAEQITTYQFWLNQYFATAHPMPAQPRSRYLVETASYTVEAHELEHKGVSLGYIIREKPRTNLDPAQLALLGLPPGPWIKQLKEATDADAMILIDGQSYQVSQLRAKLLTTTMGDSIGYFTDFGFHTATLGRIVPALQGVTTLVCESSYHPDDEELANRNTHLTSVQAAQLGQATQVGQLVLFHFSPRYTMEDWREMLELARGVFDRATVSPLWKRFATG